MSELMSTCGHGQLKRQCPICERDERIAELEASADYWKGKFASAIGYSESEIPKLQAENKALALRLDAIAKTSGGDWGINASYSMERIHSIATGTPIRQQCPDCENGRRWEGLISMKCDTCGGSARVVEGQWKCRDCDAPITEQGYCAECIEKMRERIDDPAVEKL